MIYGDLSQFNEQVRAEIKSNAPLVACAYRELKDALKEEGEEYVPVFDLSTLATLWASMVTSGVEARINEAIEADSD